jgi:hypothetical protein
MLLLTVRSFMSVKVTICRNVFKINLLLVVSRIRIPPRIRTKNYGSRPRKLKKFLIRNTTGHIYEYMRPFSAWKLLNVSLTRSFLRLQYHISFIQINSFPLDRCVLESKQDVYVSMPTGIQSKLWLSSAGILELSMGARHRVGIGLSNRPSCSACSSQSHCR